MITSRQSTGVFDNCDFQEKHFLIEPLKKLDSIKLFKKISEDEIKPHEVLELMEAMPEYPYQKLGLTPIDNEMALSQRNYELSELSRELLLGRLKNE